MSAEVTTAVQGVLNIKVDERMDLAFNLEIKQERVKQWKSFFKTETTNQEFYDEFKTMLSKDLLNAMNNELVKGVRIPFSHTQAPRPFLNKADVQFKPDMIVLTQLGPLAPTNKKQIVKYESPSRQNKEYPVSFRVSK